VSSPLAPIPAGPRPPALSISGPMAAVCLMEPWGIFVGSTKAPSLVCFAWPAGHAPSPPLPTIAPWPLRLVVSACRAARSARCVSKGVVGRAGSETVRLGESSPRGILQRWKGRRPLPPAPADDQPISSRNAGTVVDASLSRIVLDLATVCGGPPRFPSPFDLHDMTRLHGLPVTHLALPRRSRHLCPPRSAGWPGSDKRMLRNAHGVFRSRDRAAPYLGRAEQEHRVSNMHIQSWVGRWQPVPRQTLKTCSESASHSTCGPGLIKTHLTRGSGPWILFSPGQAFLTGKPIPKYILITATTC
jgi:hypothetical protein